MKFSQKLEISSHFSTATCIFYSLLEAYSCNNSSVSTAHRFYLLHLSLFAHNLFDRPGPIVCGVVLSIRKRYYTVQHEKLVSRSIYNTCGNRLSCFINIIYSILETICEVYVKIEDLFIFHIQFSGMLELELYSKAYLRNAMQWFKSINAGSADKQLFNAPFALNWSYMTCKSK